MARKYTLKRRAEQQAETRHRIVEAAIDLHGTVGPAATTVSMIAERAGVQRHTYYAHFPDDRGLLMACSGTSLERDPLPDAAPWRAIGDRAARIRTGLGAIYSWYARNAELTACVMRDAEHHQLTQEIVALRFGPPVAAWHEALGEGLDGRQRAMLALALSFFTWRTLVRDSGLDQAAAVEAMARALGC
jgi:AcrR family transcriptional regulator